MCANNRLAVLLLCACLTGCDSAPIRAIGDTYQELVYKARSKGEKEAASTDSVRREFGCNERHPFELRLEQSEIVPSRVKRGREISHRFVYAACTPNNAIQTHSLVRRITQGGRVLFEDRDLKFALIPGRWTVDAIVGIPPTAAPGIYVLEVAIEVRHDVSRKLRREFEVTQ